MRLTTPPLSRHGGSELINGWRLRSVGGVALTEAVAIKKAIEPLLKAEAKERKVEGGKLKGKASAKLAGAKGETRDKVAKRTGKKRTTLAKAEKVENFQKKFPRKIENGCLKLDRWKWVPSSFAGIKLREDPSHMRPPPGQTAPLQGFANRGQLDLAATMSAGPRTTPRTAATMFAGRAPADRHGRVVADDVRCSSG
jgi:hypothetical protein